MLNSHPVKKCIMEAISKHYEAPTTTVVDIKFEGLVCQSPDGVRGRNPYVPDDNNPFAQGVEP